MTARNSIGLSPYTDARNLLLARLRKHIGADVDIVGCLLIGSAGTGEADVFSDIDLYLYVKGSPWSRARLDEWFSNRDLAVDLHYWTGLEKHRMMVQGVRLDISTRRTGAIGELASWPALFFSANSVLKDSEGQLQEAIDGHADRVYHDADNDSDAYLLNLFAVAIQFIRGEVLNARSRLTGIIESRARLAQNLELGTSAWREPSRHAEENLRVPQLHDLYSLAFQPSPVVMRDWLVTEILAAATRPDLTPEAQAVAAYYARRLSQVQPVSY